MNNIIKMTVISLTVIMSSNAIGQNIGDALRLTQNNYYGTARSIGLGNAMTALGGDLGSVVLNPAGSAVNNFSQFTFSPNISLITTQSAYNNGEGFANTIKGERQKFTVPSIGVILNFSSGERSGLKNVTLSFIGNATDYCYDEMLSKGTNDKTSYSGEIASHASKYHLDPNKLQNDNFDDSKFPYTWDALVGFRSGIISVYGGHDDRYIGVAEKYTTDPTTKIEDIRTAGPLDQMYNRKRSGRKYDMLMNLGMNISDKLYIGGNIGFVSLYSNVSTNYRETAKDPSAFENEFELDGGKRKVKAYLDNFTFKQALKISGSGVYAKLGMIALPVNWVRIGAAIQTPTAMALRETYQCSGKTEFDKTMFNAESTSPKGRNSYRLITPYRANLGLALTSKRGLLSFDYEMADYSGMKFKETDLSFVGDNGFEEVNDQIKETLSLAHSFRAGAEFKITPAVAVRAGYNFSTSPERYIENGVKRSVKAYTKAFSFGAGYSSSDSFFCDLAFRFQKYADEYLMPYGNYIDNTPSPEIKISKGLWNIIMTFGWRF